MKRELILWSMALLTLGFVSCTQDKLDNSEIGSSKPATYSLKASLEQPGDGSRTSLTVGSDGTGATQWTTGDKIFVTKDGAATTYEFAYQKMQDDLGLFTTTSNFTTDATTYYAAYPSSMVKSMGTTFAYFNLPAVQKYSSTSAFSTDACPMVARSSKSKFEDENLLDFRNTCGMLQLQLYSAAGTKIKSIEFTAASSTAYASGNGRSAVGYAADPSSQYFFTIIMDKSQTEESSPKVTLDCTTENADGVELSTDASNPTNFFIILPPQTFTGGFTLKITDSNGNILSKTKKSDATITRSQILKMPAFDCGISACAGIENLELNENGGIDNLQVVVGETYKFKLGNDSIFTINITNANEFTIAGSIKPYGITLVDGLLTIPSADASATCQSESMLALCTGESTVKALTKNCFTSCYPGNGIAYVEAVNAGCSKTYAEKIDVCAAIEAATANGTGGIDNLQVAVGEMYKFTVLNGETFTISITGTDANAYKSSGSHAPTVINYANGLLTIPNADNSAQCQTLKGLCTNIGYADMLKVLCYTTCNEAKGISAVEAIVSGCSKTIDELEDPCNGIAAATLNSEGGIDNMEVVVGETYTFTVANGTSFTVLVSSKNACETSGTYVPGSITVSNGLLTIANTNISDAQCNQYVSLCNNELYTSLDKMLGKCLYTCYGGKITSVAGSAGCSKTLADNIFLVKYYKDATTFITVDVSTQNKTYTISSTIPENSDATKVFTNWLGSDGNTYNPGDTFTATSEMTLTAQWANKYTITYDLGDADASVNIDNPASYAGGVGATIVPLVRQGYKFDGWTGSNGATAQQAVTISTTDTGNKSYTANWTKVTTVANATGTYCDGTTGSPVYAFNKVYETGSNHTITFTNSDLGSLVISFTASENATTLSYTSNDYMEILSATVTYQDGYYAFNVTIRPKDAARALGYYMGDLGYEGASCASSAAVCASTQYVDIMNELCPLTCQTISTSGYFKKTICSTNQDVVAKCQTFSTLCLGNAAYYVPMTEKCFSTCRIDTDPNKLTGGLTVTLE